MRNIQRVSNNVPLESYNPARYSSRRAKRLNAYNERAADALTAESAGKLSPKRPIDPELSYREVVEVNDGGRERQ